MWRNRRGAYSENEGNLKEDSGIIILEGELGDNGESYEDFQITVGHKTMYEEFYKRYAGNRVRITMEIL